MTLPVPGVKSPVGLGDLTHALIFALFGIPACSMCRQRAARLNSIVTFTPLKGVNYDRTGNVDAPASKGAWR